MFKRVAFVSARGLHNPLNASLTWSNRPHLACQSFVYSYSNAQAPANGLPCLLPPSTPVILAHVCRRWRQIATSIPTFWSSISIHNACSNMVPLVRMWMECSCYCSCSTITLVYSCEYKMLVFKSSTCTYLL
ncbi:hypothetical protein BDQ17DRAFT_1360980, partial [Cyathus striatus]